LDSQALIAQISRQSLATMLQANVWSREEHEMMRDHPGVQRTYVDYLATLSALQLRTVPGYSSDLAELSDEQIVQGGGITHTERDEINARRREQLPALPAQRAAHAQRRRGSRH
jgi:hypothetical protein